MSITLVSRRDAARTAVRAGAAFWAGLVVALGLAPRAAHADPVGTNDPVRTAQWQLAALGAPAAWRYSTGSGVIVAVLDSGVDATHPDLVGQVLPGADFVDGSDSATSDAAPHRTVIADGRRDPVGHGTAVAAFIAGRADDSVGVRGLAPDVKILPVRVLDSDNRYDDPAVVADGLRWAVDHGATVVNMSLGGALRSGELAAALTYAARHDVVVIACTGNVSASSPGTGVWYPARETGVVAVAGLDEQSRGMNAAGHPADHGAGGAGGSTDLLWTGSLTGPQTILTAPATNLWGARPGGYWPVQGTSFAAPLVAASAALVRAQRPRLNAVDVVHRLITTAHDLGPVGRDDRYGYGEVNPLAALTAEAAPDDPVPPDDHFPPDVWGPPPVRVDPTAGNAVDPTAAAPEPAVATTTGTADSRVLALAQVEAMADTGPLVLSIWVGLVTFTALLWTGLTLARRRLRLPRPAPFSNRGGTAPRAPTALDSKTEQPSQEAKQ